MTVQLLPGIIADQTAAFIEPIKTLVLSDLHLGYEEELRRKGVFIPTGEFARIEKLFEALIRAHKPRTIVLNGDLKHSFGGNNDSEWRHIRLILERLQTKATVILVEGNHDPAIAPIARNAGVEVHSAYRDGDYLFIHGDRVPPPELLEGIAIIIMGHEHPAVSITNGIRSELYKCFLALRYEKRVLIVLPSTFGLTQGLDVLANTPKNPLLKDLAHANVFATEHDKILAFGTVAGLRKHLPAPARER